ncbi:MAG: hypothetical protein ACE5GV_05980 [Candidatus Scalindua sp.]
MYWKSAVHVIYIIVILILFFCLRGKLIKRTKQVSNIVGQIKKEETRFFNDYKDLKIIEEVLKRTDNSHE